MKQRLMRGIPKRPQRLHFLAFPPTIPSSSSTLPSFSSSSLSGKSQHNSATQLNMKTAKQ
ncbi:hypothetical protein E2C01_005488 [Portunus trituberculatus]|uniref:Uncharacterized protein n=1 Tax=Portunus trituberculatus TaxID=210409 RepID=A0A5B7CTM2_PORTR|nr:hypothetical protein [Portunus trituberculatus]